MIDRGAVERAIASARSKAERIEFIGALIGRATGNDAIVVGGSAIEVYTAGRTSSLDIDIVTPRQAAIPVVESWGFVPNGRIWRRKDWGVDIDLLGADLTGSRRKVRRIETPYGPVLLAGIEDLLVKRLAELKHWPTAPSWRDDLVRQVSLLLAEYEGQFDEEYLAFLTKRDDVIDLLADFLRQIPHETSSVTALSTGQE